MNTERERILARIRSALGRGPLQSAERQAVEQRLHSRAPHPLPHWSGSNRDRFSQRLRAAAATLSEIDAIDALTGEVGRYLDEHGLPAALRLADEEELTTLPWGPVRTATGPSNGTDRVCLSLAFAGIAETGTLALLSSPRTPTTLNFLSEHHLVVLHEQRILRHPEELWSELRSRPAGLPRAVNLVTGPSRTADIEQTIQIGAHGPRHLHVILIRSAPDNRPEADS